jgi:DNA-binding LytR/AlgR family response regulator
METIKNIENNSHIHVGSRKFIRPEEMQYLESDLNYTVIALRNGQKIMSSTTLKKIERRLHSFKNFIRINRSTIINLDFVESKQDNHFILPDKQIFTFSRRQSRTWKERTLK